MENLANGHLIAIIATAALFALFFIIGILRNRSAKKHVSDEVGAHREAIITASISNDTRQISRNISIASSLARRPERFIDDRDLTQALCRLLFRGGQKTLCNDLLTGITAKYGSEKWYAELEIEFALNVKKPEDKDLKKALELEKKFPSDPRPILFIAAYHDKRKTYRNDTLKYFEAASQIEAKEPRWAYALARCRQNAGNLSGALEIIKKLIEVDSRFPGAHELKRLIEEQINPPPKPAPKSKSADTPLEFSAERYSQITEMGRGGMGIVYKAFDEVLQRWVAIKTLQQSIADAQPEVKQRFLGEARILASLDHPAIPKIFDLSLKPPYYIAFELIKGISLREYLEKNGRIEDLSRFISYATMIASALAYANGKEILHRDIKPENVLVDTETDRCYIIDFGLAQIEGAQNLTKTGIVMGTPWYLAPERFSGEPASIASEIYSFGVMLYEMLEGGKPYNGNDINLVLVQEPKPVTREDAPIGLKVLIGESLSKNAANRPENFNEITQTLELLKKSCLNKDKKDENSV